jgi:glycosyltransferase involved in cell wall biosynthesis
VRIAIATDWFAPRRGGIEAQLAQLCSGLQERGHDVVVLTSTPGASSTAGLEVRSVGTALPRVHLALSPSVLADLQRELARGFDVVHAHVSVVSPVGYSAAAVARTLRLPTVLTFHSILRQKKLLLRALDMLANLSASAVRWTAVSELVATQLRSALQGAEVEVLSNGIDLAFWSHASAIASGHDRSAVTLISAMRLDRKKRPRQLLAAFARAASDAAVPALLIVVGEGPERPAMERDIRALGLDRGTARVEMPGWLLPESLRSLYADADGFVLASTRESFGIAALEAAAAGLPVIAMAAAGCREFIAQLPNGFLCRDDEELARTLAQFITKPAERSTDDPVGGPLRRYDWPAVLAKHEAVYVDAITRAAQSLAVGAS